MQTRHFYRASSLLITHFYVSLSFLFFKLCRESRWLFTVFAHTLRFANKTIPDVLSSCTPFSLFPLLLRKCQFKWKEIEFHHYLICQFSELETELSGYWLIFFLCKQNNRRRMAWLVSANNWIQTEWEWKKIIFYRDSSRHTSRVTGEKLFTYISRTYLHVHICIHATVLKIIIKR